MLDFLEHGNEIRVLKGLKLFNDLKMFQLPKNVP